VFDLSFVIEIFMNFAAEILESACEGDIIQVAWSKHEVSF